MVCFVCGNEGLKRGEGSGRQTEIDRYVHIGGVPPKILPDSVSIALWEAGLYGWVVRIFAREDAVHVGKEPIFRAGEDWLRG